ncbi:hypothetical protein BG011_000237 [Mortierella polycephala]|uniref:C3H1-type domain-containing protein n=1 Tax=Mortierella polycephala TaxID=41804 RepID=A0A9P6U769_9FUNG|nr:hypothetical protein BG011_000237 [Mortierella polycephala]
MGGAAARLTPDQSSLTRHAQKRHSSCMLSQTREYSQYVDTRSFCAGNKSMNQLSRHNTHSRSHSMKLQSDDSISNGSSCNGNGNGSGSPSGNNITQPNYKTEFCTTFRESGCCPFGDRCQFVHHEHELQRRNRALTYKTRPCWSGTDCAYQQNHARCIYLHGDETAEMFDQHRGISFTRVQKILANKELKQNRQRHHPKTTATASGEFSTIGTADSELVWSYYPYGSRFAKSMENIPVLASTFSSTQPNTTAAATAISTVISTITAPTKPLRTPKTLKIIPVLPFSSLNEPTPLAGIVSTLQTMPDLFSPGVMPAIEIPFSSHDLINEWKDPCFEEEDNNARHRIEGQHHHRHLRSKPMAAQLGRERLDTIMTKVDAKVVSECEPRQQGNLQAQPQKFCQDQPAPATTSKNHAESTGLFSSIKVRKNSMAFASQLSFALRWGSSSGARNSSSTASSGHSGSHYKLW